MHIDELAAKRETGIDQQLAAAITPNRFIRPGGPPAIIFFGTDDRLTTGAQQYLAKARPLGLRAELWTAAAQPHGFFNRSPWTEATARRVDLFLESLGYLSGPPTIEAPENAVLDEAPTPLGAADMSRDVVAVLRRNCVECHGAAKQEGGLRLDEGSAALAGGDSGDTIVAGRPDESEILRRVSLPRRRSGPRIPAHRRPR